MLEVVKLFKNLSRFYYPHLCWNQVEEIYEKDRKNSSKKLLKKSNNGEDSEEDSSDEERYISDSDIESDFDSDDDAAPSNLSKVDKVKRIPMVRHAVQSPEAVSILMELSTAIRNLRESNTGYDNTLDDWNAMKNIAPKDQYLAFIYSLLGLAKYDPTSKIYRKLSMAAASTYILSLTIPGSRPYGILDDKIVIQAIEVFHLIKEMQSEKISKKISPQDRVEIWVNFSNLGDDLKILFRYVHFDKYESMRDTILSELSKILFNNHLHGYENTYAANLHSKCFEIFEEITNAHNGSPTDTLKKIMKINFSLHFFPTPRRKQTVSIGDRNKFEHISDWFVSLITKHPSVLSDVLKVYMQYVVTNLEKEIKGEYLHKALDYAAIYDAALYINCNQSIVDYLCDAANADDIQIRINATELLIRIGQIESKVNWEMFRHEISSIPREVYIIKEIINRLRDVNNTVKLRALHGFHLIYTNGTVDSKKIVTECIKYTRFEGNNVELPVEPRSSSREIKFKAPDQIPPEYTFEGTALVEDSFKQLPNVLYFLLHNTSVNVRKTALTVLEFLVALNPLIIYKTNFVKECSKLSGDPTIVVRKQSLIMIDSVLGRYPNCYPVIFAWCKIIVPLFKDNDEKIVAYAWECFKTRVFDNIKGIDSSNMPEHYMPWIILRLLLSTQQRLFLQSCINAAINKKVINAQAVALIESHTLTSNSTEAWTMLGFVAGKIKSKEPDSLISAFMKSMEEQSWNAGQNLQIILEVLAISIKDFSHSALNMAFSCIIKLLKSGKFQPNLISKAFNFCMAISKQSENKCTKNKKNGNSSTKYHLKWVNELQISAETYLTENLRNFNDERKVLMSFLFVYSEANLELPVRPNESIVKFIHQYLHEYVKTQDRDFGPDDVNTLNQMIILAARFSIRDPNTANITCLLYQAILRRTDRPTTVNNVIVCITDLCKKHTQIVELSLSEVLNKLQSPFLEVRLVAFNNIAQLILADLMKLRGNLLLCFMTTLLDKTPELSNRSTEFFLTYLEKKNPILFQSALLECPFVFNEYLHFEGLDHFTGMEGRIESPLKGDDKAKSRQMLYKVFMLEQEEVTLLLLFNHLKLIHAKIKENDTIHSKEAFSMIKDVFYILQQICILGLEKKDSKIVREDDENGVGENDNDTSRNTASNNEASQGKKGRKSNAMTLEQAINLVEKSLHLLPQISEKLIDWDKTFEKPIEDMMIAICMRFENLVEFNEPAKFWSKYRNIAKHQGSCSSKKRKSDSKIAECDSDDENDGEVRTEKTRKSDGETISILFKPFFN